MDLETKRILRVSGWVVALFCSFGEVRAQGQGLGTLTGTVTDFQTSKPIVGAVVTAASPHLQGEQHVVTDSTGTYWLPQLQPGVYTLRVEKEKYRGDSREGVALYADQMLRINVSLTNENAPSSTPPAPRRNTRQGEAAKPQAF
jgi:hypothetical protein